MKKKILMALAVCSLATVVTACGSKSTAATAETTAAETSAEATKEAESKDSAGKDSSLAAENEDKETQAETTVDEKEAAGPGATSEDVVNQKMKNFEDLEKSDYEGFAKQVVEAVASKDMNVLADLMSYPSYVSCVKDNDSVVYTKEEFLAQDPEVIFDQELVDAVAKADLSNLEPLMAGIVIGEDTPNVIFNSVDGKLAIVGINY